MIIDSGRSRKIVICVLLTALLLCVAGVTAAPKVPAPPQPAQSINDLAGLLNEETRQELETIGAEIWEQTKADVVLVTVPSLDGVSIEEYALTLFRNWGLGDKDKNNGVLLLVDKERLLQGQPGKVRIEVGYGLEGAIPDGKAGRILDEMVLPLWEQKDYNGGIRAGYMALVAAVGNEYGIDLGANTKLAPAVEYTSTNSGGFMSFILAVLPIMIFFVVFLVTASLRRRYRRYPWWWSAFGGPRRGPFDDDFFGGGGGTHGGFGGFGGGGFSGRGGFGGGSSGGGGASR
ncbi:MAG TPA: TPM domain-containing protein [Firmicutes bacterium]|jgi:uncharacterized protein|nr:TPM domain-containing protein [Bacillota bacterium]